MNHLIGIGVGLLGGAVGFVTCFALAVAAAKAKGVSAMEGAHGYLGFAAGLIGGLVGMVLGIIVALRWQGVNGAGSLAIGSLRVVLEIAALAAFAFGIYWLAVPKLLNQNGASPMMHFEVIPPLGFAADPSTVRASLNSNSEGRPEVYITRELGKSEDGQSS